MIVLMFIMPPYADQIVINGITAAMLYISEIMTGMIIALAFFTDTLNGNKNSNSYARKST